MIHIFTNSGLEGINGLIIFIGYILAVVLSLTMHEFSHAFAAHKCGDDTAKLCGRLSLNPFKHFDVLGIIAFLFIGFGWAKPVPVNTSRFKNRKKGLFWVSISGVLTNLILAFFFSLIYILLAVVFKVDGEVGAAFVQVAAFFTTINVSLAVFNFLPIYPLDGFNFLANFTKPNNKFVEFMYKYGSLLLILLIVSGGLSTIIGFVSGRILNVFVLFWGLFF